MLATDESAARVLGSPQTVTWLPLEKQYLEADTTFLLDPDEEQTLAYTSGGIMPSDFPNGARLWSDGSVNIVAGKYRKGVQCVTSYLFEPGWPLLGTSAFHVEGWFKCSTAWASVTSESPLAIGTQTNGVQLSVAGAVMTLRFRHTQSTTTVNQAITYSLTANPIASGVWTHLAFSYSGGALTLYVNGVQVGRVTGLLDPAHWGDTTLADGLQIGGAFGVAATSFTVSDLRISGSARTPGATTTVRSGSALTIGTANGRTIDQHSLGVLQAQLGNDGDDVTTIAANVFGPTKVVRCDKLLVVTPMKAGGTDATHPTLGHSGAYSYDWQVVDRTINFITAHGAQPYVSIDATPSILGGSVLPFSGTDLTTHRSFLANFPSEIPNDFDAFATIAGDLVYHVITELATTVPYWGVWNEPDGGSFWGGTMNQYFQLYAKVAAAVKAIDATLKVGGPEVGSFHQTWTDGLIAYCAANAAPLDFISWHFYSGELSEIVHVRRTVDAAVTANGFTPIPTLINGEWTWNNSNLFLGDPGTIVGFHWPFAEYHYQINDWAAAFAAWTLIYGQRYGVVRNIFTADWSELGDTGYPSSGLSSHAHAWAPLNVFRLWSMLGSTELDVSFSRRNPGVDAIAAQGTHTDVFLTSFHYRQAHNHDVTINVSEPDDTRVTIYPIDNAHADYFDAGADHEAIESYVSTVVGGSVTVTLKPRSAALVRIG